MDLPTIFLFNSQPLNQRFATAEAKEKRVPLPVCWRGKLFFFAARVLAAAEETTVIRAKFKLKHFAAIPPFRFVSFHRNAKDKREPASVLLFSNFLWNCRFLFLPFSTFALYGLRKYPPVGR